MTDDQKEIELLKAELSDMRIRSRNDGVMLDQMRGHYAALRQRCERLERALREIADLGSASDLAEPIKECRHDWHPGRACEDGDGRTVTEHTCTRCGKKEVD